MVSSRDILEHATVRLPLLPLEPGADVEIVKAPRSAGLVGWSSAVGSREAAE
jgi:4-hydroxy-tetrahydrodipicolinate synthase